MKAKLTKGGLIKLTPERKKSAPKRFIIWYNSLGGGGWQSINRGMTGTFPSRSAAESAIRKSLIDGEAMSEYSIRVKP